MMASDSEESDYEDASQHHDSHLEPFDQPLPVPRRNLNNSPNESNVNANMNLGESPNNPVAPPPEHNIAPEVQNEEVLDQQLPAEPEAQQQVILFPVPAHILPEPHENDYNFEYDPRIPADRRINWEDSDSDSLDYISEDDSEGEFPLLNPPSSERDRASDDAHEAADMDDDAPEFDQELPIRHTYLGDGMEELQGRILLEDDATPEVPLIAMSQHLIPGQTLPLQVYHSVFQNAIRRCVNGDRLFGIVHNALSGPQGNVIYVGAVGTLAEIFEFQEEGEGIETNAMSSTFAVKAKGRQRFTILEVRRQADGNLMGKVRIRPEIRLQHFMYPIFTPAVVRTMHNPQALEINVVPSEQDEEETVGGNAEASSSSAPPSASGSRSRLSSLSSRFRLSSRRDSLSSVVSTTSTATTATTAAQTAQIEKDLALLRAKVQCQRKRLKYYAPFTPHPYFVMEQYDETVLVERVHTLLTTELKGVAKSKGKIPMDASDLSFWLAQNLPIDDTHRTKVLRMNCPVQRLRYYVQLFGKTTKIISCRSCETPIADHAQIFSMSIEGPQGTYVNPHGFVHETLTVYKARELVTRGAPSTEASWFPGYAWTIVECRRCKTHIGWKFQAVDRLKPSRFWGLARRSVISKYDFGSDADEEEAGRVDLDLTQDPFLTPPNSANSEGYSTVALF